MSLDVWLEVDKPVIDDKHTGIYVREDGQTKEIRLSEWQEKFPNKEPVTITPAEDSYEVFSYNITHNLNKMAAAANIYTELWRPGELGYTKAKQLIQPLQIGYELLLADPAFFKIFNPENGWGNYEGLVKFVKEYLQACKDNPDADIRISR